MGIAEMEAARDAIRAASTGSADLDQTISLAMPDDTYTVDSSDCHIALQSVEQAFPENPEMQMSILNQAIDLGKRPEAWRDQPVLDWLALAIYDELLTTLIVKERTGG